MSESDSDNLQSMTGLAKKKYKNFDPLIWFLYDDPEKSCQELSTQYLAKSIKHSIQVMISVHYYFAGIMNKKAFMYWLDSDPDRKTQMTDKMFPGCQTMSVRKYSYSFAKHRVSKWARKCLEHYLLVERFLVAALAEWEFRYHHQFNMFDVADELLFCGPPSALKKANLKKIQVEWKSIPPKYRNKDIHLSYRKYFLRKLEKDGFNLTEANKFYSYNRDVPDFVLEYFVSNNIV